jgi:hypothetical protein
MKSEGKNLNYFPIGLAQKKLNWREVYPLSRSRLGRGICRSTKLLIYTIDRPPDYLESIFYFFIKFEIAPSQIQ